jgi:hypothetical protein
MIPDNEFLTLSEHAAVFRLAVNAVRNRISLGTWPAKSVRVGKNILIPRLEHERVVAEILGQAGINPTLPKEKATVNQTNFNNLKRGPGRPRKGVK